MKTHNTDLITGLGGLAFTVIFGLARERWSPLSAQWPNAILAFMLLGSIFLLVRAFVKPEMAALFDEGDRRRMVVCVVLLFVWSLAIQVFGFIVTSVGLFYFFWWFVSRAVRKVDGDSRDLGLIAHVRALVLTAFMVGAFYFIFTSYLHVPLPRGFLV